MTNNAEYIASLSCRLAALAASVSETNLVKTNPQAL